MNFWKKKEAKRLSQELPFYDKFVEKPRIKRLKNLDLLHALSFYNKLDIEKISKTLKNMQEVINKKLKIRLKRSFCSVKR